MNILLIFKIEQLGKLKNVKEYGLKNLGIDRNNLQRQI